MIHRKHNRNHTQENFTDPLRLLEQLNLTPQQIIFSPQAAQQFQFKAPKSYTDKIKPEDPDDPLLLQIFPVQKELESHPEYTLDPLAEAQSLTQPGLLQKYQGRALLLVTPGCAINCRYCFRRHYPYDNKGHYWEQIKRNILLLKKSPDIHEVILSGGDPLSLSDNKLDELITMLESIPHLKRLRIHSRFPIVEPSRVTNKLLERLNACKLRIIMVLHINHAQEIGLDNEKAIQKLYTHHITLFNQSVLLKGINDTVDSLVQLSETLIEHHITPYYLHMLDKVHGCSHFEVSDAEATALYLELRTALPGYLLPRLVKEIPGKTSKLPFII